MRGGALWGGVYASDALPLVKVKGPKAFIVNLSESSSRGTHWIALWVPADGPTEHFCSFGSKPQEGRITDFLRLNAPFVSTRRTLQSSSTVVCGMYCCAFLIWRAAGRSLSDFLLIFSHSNLLANDQIVLKWTNSRFHIRESLDRF